MKDVLVIGAGPAGCVAASHLANKGYKVTIVEKSKFPRHTIGESLLPISMENFEETGLLPALEKAGFEIKSGAFFLRNKEEINISFAENFTPGWTWTWQVPRDDFDDILAKETEKKGVRILYESVIEDLDFQKGFIEVNIGKADKILSEKYDFVVDSSGNSGVLSNMLSIKKTFAHTGRKSIFTQVKDVRANEFEHPKRISFEVLAKDLWFWVIPFSNGNTSLGFVGDNRWFDQSKDLNELFGMMLQKSDGFKKRFQGLYYLFDVKQAVDYTCKTERLFGDRFVLTGNTTGFIDPIFSSGVAMATTSAMCAAKLVDKYLKGEDVDWQVSYSDYVNKAGNVFKTFIDAWYDGSLQDLFFYPNIQMNIKKQLTSVLAGYVWDDDNPFVKKNFKLIKTLSKVIKLEAKRTMN